MKQSDRKAHWEQVYDGKSPLQVSWFQQEPTLSLQLIENASVRKDAPIIDIGGGASVLVDRLLAKYYSHLSVLDISSSALEHAQERLGSLAKNVEWYTADVTEFHPPYRFSLWHDRAVFHFLTEKSDREKYLEVLKNALDPQGQVVIAAFAIGGPSKCSGLDIVQYDSARLMDVFGRDFSLVEEFLETHITPGNGQQNFCYFRLARL